MNTVWYQGFPEILDLASVSASALAEAQMIVATIADRTRGHEKSWLVMRPEFRVPRGRLPRTCSVLEPMAQGLVSHSSGECPRLVHVRYRSWSPPDFLDQFC